MGIKLRNISNIKMIDNFRKIYIVNKNYNLEEFDINYIQDYLTEKVKFD